MFGENHAHIFMNGINYKEAVKTHEKEPDENVIRLHLKAYQDRGILFLRDGGDALRVSERARELAPEYGIDYRSPLFAIHKNGHYGAIVGRGFDSMKEYASLVKEVKKRGGDFIKIMTTGIMDFETDGSVTGVPLSEQEVREMVHIAHEEGLAVMAHTNGAQPVIQAVLAGADSIEHGNYMNEEALGVLAQSDTVWVPTITVIKNMLGCGRYKEEVLRNIWNSGKENIRKGYALGAHLALGSDAGAYLVPHGKGLEDEWGCFREILGDSPQVRERLLSGEETIRRKFKKL